MYLILVFFCLTSYSGEVEAVCHLIGYAGRSLLMMCRRHFPTAEQRKFLVWRCCGCRMALTSCHWTVLFRSCQYGMPRPCSADYVGNRSQGEGISADHVKWLSELDSEGKGICCHFFWICQMEKTMSTFDPSARKPNALQACGWGSWRPEQILFRRRSKYGDFSLCGDFGEMKKTETPSKRRTVSRHAY